MITEEVYPVHLPPALYNILYVGYDLALLDYLQEELENCCAVRCPTGSVARALIKGIEHSLLLFDEELPDMSGEELAEFTRSVPRREQTPIVVFKASDDFEELASAITLLLVQEGAKRVVFS
jgi:DNA-binding response OmpR family regulator